MLQDIDVETLMQEIKQWGPQQQAGGEAGGAEPDSQTPRRVSPDKADQAAASPSQSLTPNQSTIHEESSSSSEKVSSRLM